MMTEPETPRQAFERMGVHQVRYLLISGNLAQSWVKHAVGWLADHDESERSRNDASQASQTRTALSAKNAAWIAAIAAIIAAVTAIIAGIVTYLSWAFPRR
jgi:hypothetical protein